jgi:hypothetical protein
MNSSCTVPAPWGGSGARKDRSMTVSRAMLAASDPAAPHTQRRTFRAAIALPPGRGGHGRSPRWRKWGGRLQPAGAEQVWPIA